MCSHATMCSRLQTSLHPSSATLAMLPGNVDRGNAHATGHLAKASRAVLAARTPCLRRRLLTCAPLFGLQPPCDYFGAQTQRSPCVMYPNHPPTWWCQISALNTCFSPTPVLLGPLPARRQHINKRCWRLSISQSAARCSLASSATATVAAAAAQCASCCGMAVEADAAVACCRSCCHCRTLPRRTATKPAPPPLTLATSLASPGQPNPRSCPHTLLLPLPAAAAAATATAAAQRRNTNTCPAAPIGVAVPPLQWGSTAKT